MIGCIIQARLGSTRLPEKIMMHLDNKNSVLDYVVNQLKFCTFLDKIIIATTTLKQDNLLVKYSKNNQLDYFCGNENDVLDRFYQCAKKFHLTNIVRVTSDCPLIDPNIVDTVIDKFVKGNFDYATNKLPLIHSKCPHGTEVEVFSFKTLEKIWLESKKISEREHVTPYIYNNPKKFRIFNLFHEKDFSHLRYTIDRPKDMELVQKIVQKIKTRPILTKNIVELFTSEPELLLINSEYERNEGYFKSVLDEK
jgi:spore coat polysaccharide biosynthesis protein SpsF